MKLEAVEERKLPMDPIDLFQTLFHKEGYAYLRGIQEEVLKEWNDKRDERDVLCKMNTGSGKTLVSLMMLYSKMVEGVGTVLYLCPDKQLLEQAKIQAELYGIPVCEIEEGNQFPADFHNCKSILLCTFHRMFNAKSIFERDNISVGAIVIDDAHSCLDISREVTTLKLLSSHPISQRIIKLFEKDLIFQAPGSYRRLMDGDPYAKILKVPYWSWLDRKDEILAILNEYAEDKELLFKWGLIADDLLSFDCYIGPRGVEIAPIHVPFHNIRTFNEAKHRYILSATFEDQIDLIKDFGINKVSIINALVPRDRKDIGQRLILAPRRYDPNINDADMHKLAVEYSNDGVNVVVLVPSADKAKQWINVGGEILSGEHINVNIEKLKKSNGGLYILINRYDGIDLHANMCRILIIDGYPAFTSYKELYTEMRLDSVKASLKAQIIEQGLGRAVRSGSDYCTVYLMGNDLLQFLGNNYNLQFFTAVTRKQLEIGLSLLDGQSKDNSLVTIRETTDLCLTQSPEWRAYHSQELSGVESDKLNDEKIKNLNIAQAENDAIDLYRSRNYQAAKEVILKRIIEINDLTGKQNGWYFQLAAQFLYMDNKPASNDLQIKASKTTPHMFQTALGHNYTKISANEEQSSNVLKFISQFNKSHDFKIYLEEVLGSLIFSPDVNSSKFENALANVGRILGYYAQEPESDFGNGPDVLWGMTDNHYLILEAKSMAIHGEITRENIGQLLQSGEWFKTRYGAGMSHTLVTLQAPSIKGWNVNPSENSKVIDENSLNKLRENLAQFVNGIVSHGTIAITSLQIAKLLGAHNFTPIAFRETYLTKIVLKKK
ncbi:DEAD/DEAH box helicase [Flavobacterium acetivorans]|uniref:DEAD/DEAH box helicase n=1 Tax=Flavobacterium acetivorans TaxID=2893883 RepID=UPI001E3D4A1F|nr:DEAD/DEAH box helicase [Flavobacterium sp. F-29]UFH34554.1 DEAD/DEAH box helicase family protein [Flavobacterium sp. F-29]